MKPRTLIILLPLREWPRQDEERFLSLYPCIRNYILILCILHLGSQFSGMTTTFGDQIPTTFTVNVSRDWQIKGDSQFRIELLLWEVFENKLGFSFFIFSSPLHLYLRLVTILLFSARPTTSSGVDHLLTSWHVLTSMWISMRKIAESLPVSLQYYCFAFN